MEEALKLVELYITLEKNRTYPSADKIEVLVNLRNELKARIEFKNSNLL